jgi:hypothetical protein
LVPRIAYAWRGENLGQRNFPGESSLTKEEQREVEDKTPSGLCELLVETGEFKGQERGKRMVGTEMEILRGGAFPS